MNKLHRVTNITVNILCASLLLACNRAELEDKSRITVSFENAALGMISSLPAGKKACFGINVTGTNIPTRPGTGSCGPAIGTAVGFVPENTPLTVEVEQGPDRTFQLFAYVLDDASDCPTVDQVLASSGGSTNVYLVGTTPGVSISKAVEDVPIKLNFPGLTHSVYADYNMMSCGNAGTLRATLDSSGNVIAADASSTLLQAIATLESFWVTVTNTFSSATSTNLMIAEDVAVSPEVFSLTMKPDTQKLYGLLQGGQIVEVNAASGTYSAPLACPFNVTNCTVPVWMQSISAGNGTDLFALDQSGNLYRIDGATPTDLSINVGATVQQVSYF